MEHVLQIIQDILFISGTILILFGIIGNRIDKTEMNEEERIFNNKIKVMQEESRVRLENEAKRREEEKI